MSRGTLAALLLLGCSTTAHGTVHDVDYELAGPIDGATLLEPSEREDVWAPPASDLPILSLRVEALDAATPRCVPSPGYELVDEPLVGAHGGSAPARGVRVRLCSAAHPNEVVLCTLHNPISLRGPTTESAYSAICHAIHLQ